MTAIMLTPSNEVVDAEWRSVIEDVGGHPGVEVDALDEHPEDGRLEAEYEHGLHGAAEEGVVLVPLGGLAGVLHVRDKVH